MSTFWKQLGQIIDTVFTWPYARYAWANFRIGHWDGAHRSFYLSIALSILLGFTLRWANFFVWHFEAQSLLWLPRDIFFFVVVLFYIYLALSIEHRFPRTVLFSLAVLWLVILGEIQLFCVASIIDTPFHLIDHYLIAIDRFMHINVVDVVVWAHPHVHWFKVLKWCYNTWLYQLILAPLTLAYAQKRRLLIFYLTALQWLFFIAYIIYFFMPSVGPGAIFQQAYFPHSEKLLGPFIYGIHHHVKHLVSPTSGLISFPSYHVIGALLVIFIAIKGLPLKRVWAQCVLFFLVILNLLLICSTILLGHHYVIDDIVGLIIMIPVAYWLYGFDCST